LFPNSTNGFAQLNVKGRSLVPYPPTRIKAFILTENGRKIKINSTIYGNDV